MPNNDKQISFFAPKKLVDKFYSVTDKLGLSKGTAHRICMYVVSSMTEKEFLSFAKKAEKVASSL